jgi:hypothetical protein
MVGPALYTCRFDRTEKRRLSQESLRAARRSDVEHHEVLVWVVEESQDPVASAAVSNERVFLLSNACFERPKSVARNRAIKYTSRLLPSVHPQVRLNLIPAVSGLVTSDRQPETCLRKAA